jgi:hypothetical protein
LDGAWGAEAADPGEDAGGQHPPGLTAHLVRPQPAPGNPRGHGFFQASIDLQPGADYLLTFWGRASKPTPFLVYTKDDCPPWAIFGARATVTFDTAWRRYKVAFNAKDAIPQHTRITFGYSGPDAAEVWLADVALRKTDALDGPNLIANGQFENGLAQWVVDGKQNGVYDAAYQIITADGTPANETTPAPAAH